MHYCITIVFFSYDEHTHVIRYCVNLQHTVYFAVLFDVGTPVLPIWEEEVCLSHDGITSMYMYHVFFKFIFRGCMYQHAKYCIVLYTVECFFCIMYNNCSHCD